MLIVETAVVATWVCASTRRTRALSEADLHLISGGTKCIQVASGRAWSEQ